MESKRLIQRQDAIYTAPLHQKNKICTAKNIVVFSVLFFGSIHLIAKYIIFEKIRSPCPPAQPQLDIAGFFLDTPSPEQLRKHLQYYTSGTHVAGINRTQAVYTRDYFKEQGIEAEIVEYYPWMNYPLDQRVALFNSSTDEVAFEAGLKEDVIPGDPATDDPNNLPAFHGYSADGNATGQLVYANYGSREDFQALKDAGISIKDKIVLVRYGNVFRGLKVFGAELDGARGVLIYSDPADDGYVKGKVYPDGPWRPESSFQRGSVQRMTIYPGDPLTPGYAATKDAPRLKPEEVKNLNTIPSLPISYRDAEPLLRAIQGYGKQAKTIGDNWVGGLTLKGVEYWTGPSELNVNLLNKVEYKVTSIQNVIARIPGYEEPERAVIIGNHRDAWCAGASDPSSGSAVLLELARSFGKLLKLGWRPRRTIIFASWDAEEYFTVGSTEWGEDNRDWIRATAVSYINIDPGVRGRELSVKGSPIFRSAVYEAAKSVKSPHSNKTVFDVWKKADKMKDYNGVKVKRPVIEQMGSGSDFTVFLDHIGVSSIDIGYTGNSGTYHSNYDSFKWLTTFVDPDFAYHHALTQVIGLLAIRLIDDPVIPLSPKDYAYDIQLYVEELDSHITQASKKHSSPQRLTRLFDAAYKIKKSAKFIDREIRHLRKEYGEECNMSSRHKYSVCSRIRDSINERLVAMERNFIDPEGIPGREWYKHVLVSPHVWKGYAPQTFPALNEAAESGDWKLFHRLEKSTADIMQRAAWELRES